MSIFLLNSFLGLTTADGPRNERLPGFSVVEEHESLNAPAFLQNLWLSGKQHAVFTVVQPRTLSPFYYKKLWSSVLYRARSPTKQIVIFLSSRLAFRLQWYIYQ